MTTDESPRSDAGTCDFCGRELSDQPIEDGTQTFCSTGCRDVQSTLGDVDLEAQSVLEPTDSVSSAVVSDDPGSGSSSGSESEAGETDTAEDGSADDSVVADHEPTADDTNSTNGERHTPNLVRTFLRIDGMHSPTCETFLESVADSQSGVVGAEASYVTETIRVDYDRTRVSKSDLRDALSTVGYTAYLRDDAAGADADGSTNTNTNTNASESTGTTRRSREMSGLRKRRSDDMMDARYILGVVFGAFLLIPYVALLYPSHLASVYSAGPLQHFEGSFADSGGLLFMRVYFVLTGIVLYVTGMPLLRGAYVSLKMRRPNTDLLAAITIVSAFLYSTVAVVVGSGDIYYDLVLVIAAIVMGGIFYESSVKQRAMDRLTELTISQVDSARRYDATGTPVEVDVGDLESGDRVLVRQGERIPVDGVLAEGECTVDEAVVTGESLPVSKHAGDDVVGGSVVTAGAAVVTVGDRTSSSIDRLTTTVWNLQSADHGIQRRADRLAATVAPAIVAGALLVGVSSFAMGADAVGSVLASLTVLVVACPWALGFATPLSIATSIEAAMERGIVVFDETVFERLRDIDVVVFDKTGTLTRGRMDVLEADGPEDLLTAAGLLERRASHPAAEAIVSAFANEGDTATADRGSETDTDTGTEHDGTHVVGGGVDDQDRTRTQTHSQNRDQARTQNQDQTGSQNLDRTQPQNQNQPRSQSQIERQSQTQPESQDQDQDQNQGHQDRVTDFETHSNGVEGIVDGERILVGHLDLFAERGWSVDETIESQVLEARGFGRLPIVIGRNGCAEGIIVVGDEPREGWEATVTRLSDRGIEVIVLTGDDEEATDFFSSQPAVEHVFAGVPPAGKTATIRRLRADNRVTMVGDGTNDAPALAEADLGISLGSGTALASDAADLAIVDDNLEVVETVFDLASSARRRVNQNTTLALLYNVIAIPIALVGLLNPLFATAAVVVSSLLIAANSSRSLLEGDE